MPFEKGRYPRFLSCIKLESQLDVAAYGFNSSQTEGVTNLGEVSPINIEI